VKCLRYGFLEGLHRLGIGEADIQNIKYRWGSSLWLVRVARGVCALQARPVARKGIIFSTSVVHRGEGCCLHGGGTEI
jgi:hypothetical protein